MPPPRLVMSVVWLVVLPVHLAQCADELAAAGELSTDWIAVQADDGQTYYWNTVTDETSWNAPAAGSVADGSSGSWTVEIHPDTGATYYYNAATGVSTWGIPESLHNEDGLADHASSSVASNRRATCRDIVQLRRRKKIGIVLADYGDGDPTPLTIQWPGGPEDKTFLVSREDVAVASEDNVSPLIRATLERLYNSAGDGNCNGRQAGTTADVDNGRQAGTTVDVDMKGPDMRADTAEEAVLERTTVKEDGLRQAATIDVNVAQEQAAAETRAKAAAEEQVKAGQKAAQDQAAANAKAKAEAEEANADADAEGAKAGKKRAAEEEYFKKAEEKAAQHQAATATRPEAAVVVQDKKHVVEEEQVKADEKAAQDPAAAPARTDAAAEEDVKAVGKVTRERVTVATKSNSANGRVEQVAKTRAAKQELFPSSTSGTTGSEGIDLFVNILASDAVWGALLDVVLDAGPVSAELWSNLKQRWLTSSPDFVNRAAKVVKAKHPPQLSRLLETVLQHELEVHAQHTHSTHKVSAKNTPLFDVGPVQLEQAGLQTASSLAALDSKPSRSAPTPNQSPTVTSSWTLPPESLPMHDVDTNDKKLGNAALVHLVAHSAALASAFNSPSGFSLSLISSTSTDRRYVIWLLQRCTLASTASSVY